LKSLKSYIYEPNHLETLIPSNIETRHVKEALQSAKRLEDYLRLEEGMEVEEKSEVLVHRCKFILLDIVSTTKKNHRTVEEDEDSDSIDGDFEHIQCRLAIYCYR